MFWGVSQLSASTDGHTATPGATRNPTAAASTQASQTTEENAQLLFMELEPYGLQVIDDVIGALQCKNLQYEDLGEIQLYTCKMEDGGVTESWVQIALCVTESAASRTRLQMQQNGGVVQLADDRTVVAFDNYGSMQLAEARWKEVFG